jgi:hypothetical protein
MQFAIMQWLNNGASVGSIYGILDKDNPGQLPTLSRAGYWSDVREVDESQVPYAGEAKKSIAEHGYYLTSGTSLGTVIPI